MTSQLEHRMYLSQFVFLMVLSNISVISWRSGLLGTRRKPPTCRKSLTNFYHIMLNTSPRSGFELTTSVVIGTDCIGSCIKYVIFSTNVSHFGIILPKKKHGRHVQLLFLIDENLKHCNNSNLRNQKQHTCFPVSQHLLFWVRILQQIFLKRNAYLNMANKHNTETIMQKYKTTQILANIWTYLWHMTYFDLNVNSKHTYQYLFSFFLFV